MKSLTLFAASLLGVSCAGVVDAKIDIALAGLAYGKRADFLRAYGIARLPADLAIRARAAKMLIEQKQPELA